MDRVLSGRQMQAEDRDGSPEAPFDVRPGEFGGQRQVHYADLMLLREAAGRVAVELVLAAPQPDEFAAVLRGYGADARMAGVLLLVNDPWVGRLVQSLAAGLELTAFARVQRALLG